MHQCHKCGGDTDFYENYLFDLIEKIEPRVYDCYYSESDGKKGFILWFYAEDDPTYDSFQAHSFLETRREANREINGKVQLSFDLTDEPNKFSAVAKIMKDISLYEENEYF